MKFLVWILLALPGVWQTVQLSRVDMSQPDQLRSVIQATGDYAAWLIILTLCITPLVRLTRGQAFARWLQKNRRYIGVAAFFYTVAHTYLYILRRGWAVIGDSLHYSIWTGWLALFILVPLTVTSNDAMVRRMGPAWKRLQKWAYAAAVLTLLHWITLHRGDLIPLALASFLPLAILTWTRLRGTRIRKAQGEPPG